MPRFFPLSLLALAWALPAAAQPVARRTVQVPGTDYRKAEVALSYVSLEGGSGGALSAYIDLLRVPIGPLSVMAGFAAGVALTDGDNSTTSAPYLGELNARAGFDVPVNPTTLVGVYGGYATAGYTNHYAIGPLAQVRVHSGRWRGEARVIVGVGSTEAPYHLQVDARRVIPLSLGLSGELQGGLKLVLVDGSPMIGFTFVGTD